MKKLKVGRVFKQATGAMYLITTKLSDKTFIGECIESNFDKGKIMRFWFTGKPYFNGNESEIYYTGTNQYLTNVKAKTEKYYCSYCCTYHKDGYDCGFYPGWEYD